jgi:hypothetical protein
LIGEVRRRLRPEANLSLYIDSDGAEDVAVRYVDPASLLIDTNVRLDARIDADFVASIRDLGVLVPIVAVRTLDGDLRVRFGHRRTIAATRAGRSVVKAQCGRVEGIGPVGHREVPGRQRLAEQGLCHGHAEDHDDGDQCDPDEMHNGAGACAAKVVSASSRFAPQVDSSAGFATAISGSAPARTKTVPIAR